MNFGLLARKERWSLTWRGCLVLLFIAVLAAVTIRLEAYPFLALNRPVNADILVVDAWIPEYAVNQVVAEYKRGRYGRVLVVGSDFGAELKSPTSQTDEDEVATLLVQYGVPQDSVTSLSYPAVERDRTYHSALAVKKWLEASGASGKPINAVTMGPHARRSWLMFRKAFGNDDGVGIVALRDPQYDPKRWWRTSEGVRDILGEFIAYVYATFFYTFQ